jgi:DNA-binding NarL/FixJ family response regulator
MAFRFLIVDDSESVRKGLRTLIQTHSAWQVCGEAADGAEAVRLLRDLRPDLVILDFLMPGMNGLETARQMRKIAPNIPIVMFTQHASRELEQHAYEAGIRSMISKSDAFAMVEKIEKLLGPQPVKQSGILTDALGEA